MSRTVSSIIIVIPSIPFGPIKPGTASKPLFAINSAISALEAILISIPPTAFINFVSSTALSALIKARTGFLSTIYTSVFKIKVDGIFKNLLNSSIEWVLGVSMVSFFEKYSLPSTTAG